MLVTWTTLRSPGPVTRVPWQPRGARWWQAGPSSPGRAEPPRADGSWWSVLASWDDGDAAAAGPGARDGLDAWHVVLAPACYRGDAVLAGGARPFDAVPAAGRVHGAAALVTLAGPGADAAREREFFRRFMHLSRAVPGAAGHVAALVQAPADGALLTFSAWRSLDDALGWAYAQPQHAGAVARQAAHRLVRTSGFLRCAVLSSAGTLGDAPDPLAGLRGTTEPLPLGAGR